MHSQERLGRSLEQHYDQLAAQWETVESPQYGNLVVPIGNSDAPIHRWFHLKEAYSRNLLPTVLEEAGLAASEDLSLVDPFSGVGTTLLSALDLSGSREGLRILGRGMEVNPFLHAVASIKVQAAHTPPPDVVETLGEVLSDARELKVGDDALPSLSTFRKTDYFPRENVREIVALRTAVESSGIEPVEKALGLLAVAMTVEPASRLRRDGRTLRFEQRETRRPFEVFEEAVKRIATDLDAYRGPQMDADVAIHHGSAVSDSWPGVPDSGSDLVLFSPPYPNNIDYTEVYKTELWALNHVDSSDAFRAQRHNTLRSHPSVKFERSIRYITDPRKDQIGELIDPILNQIESESRYFAQLERLVNGYSDDMLHVLDMAFKSLRPGGRCVYVVGNSVHGTTEAPLMIASDIVLARLAELSGLVVDKIHVARHLPRRRTGSKYVRESVVFLTKPEHPRHP